MRTRAPATAKRLASGCLIAPRGAPGYNEVTLCYDDNAASEIDAAAILTEGRCEYKMQKQTHFSAVPRSGPEALRRTSEGTIRKCEIEKQTHFIRAIAGFLRRKVVLQQRPRSATGSHQSVTRHSMPTGHRSSRYSVRRPASLEKRAEEGTYQGVQNNPTSRQCRERS